MKEELIVDILTYLLEGEKEKQTWVHKTFNKKCESCDKIINFLKELRHLKYNLNIKKEL